MNWVDRSEHNYWYLTLFNGYGCLLIQYNWYKKEYRIWLGFGEYEGPQICNHNIFYDLDMAKGYAVKWCKEFLQGEIDKLGK